MSLPDRTLCWVEGPPWDRTCTPIFNDTTIALATEITRLRDGLEECALESGADVSDGVPTWPDIVAWAVESVRELRQVYDQERR